jgi:hypothetical protein
VCARPCGSLLRNDAADDPAREPGQGQDRGDQQQFGDDDGGIVAEIFLKESSDIGSP